MAESSLWKEEHGKSQRGLFHENREKEERGRTFMKKKRGLLARENFWDLFGRKKKGSQGNSGLILGEEKLLKREF